MDPTNEQIELFRQWFDRFNTELFANRLPRVMLNQSRKKNAAGFFAPSAWTANDDPKKKVHEITLTPGASARTGIAVAATLLHEMVHLAQEVDGKAPRKGYHDHDFAHRMEAVGLITSTDGTPEGKRVGQKMTHYLDTNGPFVKLWAKMQKEKRKLARPVPFGETFSRVPIPTPKPVSKLKYSCPLCGANVWGKPDLKIACVADDHDEPEMMKPEEA